MDGASHPQLRDQQKVIIGGGLPVDHMHRLNSLSTLHIAYVNSHTILEQQVDLSIGVDKAEDVTGSGQLFDSEVESFFQETRIKPFQGATQARNHHDLKLAFTVQFITTL